LLLYLSIRDSKEIVFGGHRLRATLLNRPKSVEGDYVFPGRIGGHKTIQINRALEAAFRRASITDFSPHNLRKTFATRLLSKGAAITDVQHLLGHASVKTTEKAYAAFVKNERFKQTIDLLDKPVQPKLKVVSGWLYKLGWYRFIELLIGTICSEFLDHIFFWKTRNLEQKLVEFRQYYNRDRVYQSLVGVTPPVASDNPQPLRTKLSNYSWISHCNGLFRTPIAACIVFRQPKVAFSPRDA